MAQPSVTMNQVGLPAKLFHSFQHTPSKKYASFIVVCEKTVIRVSVHTFSLEIIFVVNKVDLHAGSRDRGNLDN